MLVQFKIEKETEKALSVRMIYQLNDNATRQIWSAWLPKSQVKVTDKKETGDVFAEIPEWLAGKIGGEICSYFNYRSLTPANIVNVEII